MNQAGIVEIDLHGMNKYQAKIYIDSQLRKAKGGVYRIRVIHGYNRGTELKQFIQKEYGKKHPRVLRVEQGLNPGESDLVLKEF